MKSNVFFLYVAMVLLTACGGDTKVMPTRQQRQEMNEKLEAVHSVDSLQQYVDRFRSEGNALGEIIAWRRLGTTYRYQSLFDKAIDAHQHGYDRAVEVKDTLEMVQALNNLGTNYRRLGVLDEASSYHLQALNLNEHIGDQTDDIVRKNHVVSLNGLGNIYLSLGNWQQADSVFRQALIGERLLGSHLGQAINLSNIGAVKEQLGQTDSAWLYYRQSMEMNERAHSQLGIALCHRNYGGLYEKDGQDDKALEEYQIAYRLMGDSQDHWHREDVAMSIARVYIKQGRYREATDYLEAAHAKAVQMGSLEHKAAVHKLFYELYEKQGDSRQALRHYIRGSELEDSLINVNKLNQIQNMRIAIERENRQHQLQQVEDSLATERSSRLVIIIVALLFGILALVVISMLYYHLRAKNANQRIVQQLQRAREDFFTNVTHEFRTPLTVILGLGHQLEDENIEDMGQVRSSAKMIVRQGNSLLGLINQLLDVSKVRSAVGQPQWRQGNIVAFVEMAIDNFRPYAESKRQELTYSHSMTVIDMDFVPDYVQKIVSNLVANAIKYTPQYGKINVTLEQNRTGSVKLQVFDTGRGIDAKVLPHVFDAFFQGEVQSGDVGTGVGLSLVKLMVESMNGTVSAESVKGQGSTFTVTLPMTHRGVQYLVSEDFSQFRVQNMLTEDTDTIADDTSEAGDKTRVLIIEDNQDIAHYIGMHLTECSLLYARSGEEGLRKALEFMPDLIITDIMMPGDINGLDLCREVRKTELLSHIPIIIVTAKTTEKDRVEGLKAGADAYLVKPFNSEELLVRVHKLLERQRQMRQKYAELGRISDDDMPQDELSAVDRQFMNRLVDVVYQHMVKGSLDMQTLADEMKVSRTQLNRKVMAITGLNASTYVMKLRMSRARRLLKADITMSIGDVAQKCGFEDMAYFSRLFKQMYQETPSQYRKKT